MKKLLIASAVSAAFAAPTVALAQAARAPTLSQVLDASGLNVSGYLDAGYTYANRNVETTGFSNRVFDSQNNSFALHQFGLTVAKQPTRGFGGVVNITAGSDAQAIHAFPETTNPAGSMFDITQAYGQYAAGDLTLMAGKFVTLAGTEVIASPSNMNFSRSMLFGAIPFTHTGVRAGYAVSNTVTLYGGINNGWDQLTDANKGKTVELGASITPIKPLTINLAGYFAYNFSRQWRIAARAELFDDKNNFHFGPNNQAANSEVKYKEVTGTLAYLPNSSVELRGEIRADNADKGVFINSDGTTAKSLLTLGFQGLYKF